MRSYFVFLTALFLNCVFACPVFAQKNPQRVVIIGLDGISVEGFNTAKHPHLDTLFAEGVLSLSTRPVMPSVTMPNWTSHLTGSGPEEHGVINNNWLVDNHELKALETDDQGFYPSIFKLLKDHIPNVKTAFYYNWAQLINSMNKKYLDDIKFQWNDGYDSLHRQAINFMNENRKNPTLVFLYSVHTDHAGHTHGWMSSPYISSIEQADSSIGRFLNELKEKELYKDTHFLLITDHGGNPKSGHGGTSMDEMQVPWAITGPQIRKQGITKMYNSNKNTAWVIARIFNVNKKNIPTFWTGVLPDSIFK